MEILADYDICQKAYDELSKAFHLELYDSLRYRFTEIALKRNFDVGEANRYIKAYGLSVELLDTKFAVHIKDKKVNKGTGLLRIAERMGIDIREFAAIGDSKSDVPMFNVAGFRASVANASPELKETSDYIANKSYGSGFAEIIKHMGEHGIFSPDSWTPFS